MGLFSLPPKQPQADLDLEFFLKNGLVAQDNKRFKRMLAPEWFPQSAVQLTWPHAGTDWVDMLSEVIACYKRMAYEIAIREPLLIVAPNTAEVKAVCLIGFNSITFKIPITTIKTTNCNTIKPYSCPENIAISS